MVAKTHFGDPPLSDFCSTVSTVFLPLLHRFQHEHISDHWHETQISQTWHGGSQLRPWGEFYRSDASAQPTCFLWLFQIFVLLSMCPPSSNSCITSNILPSFIHMFLHKGDKRQGWEIVASLGHNSTTPTCLTGEQQSWRCKSENLCRTARIFSFLAHVEWNTWESGGKIVSNVNSDTLQRLSVCYWIS